MTADTRNIIDKAEPAIEISSDSRTSVADYLQHTVNCFRSFGIENATMEARWLFQHLLGKRQPVRNFCLSRQILQSDMDVHEKKYCHQAIDKRAQKEPLAYIIGNTEFYNATLRIPHGVLIPRSDSEAVIELLKDIIPPAKPQNHNNTIQIADIATGSACLVIAIAELYGEYADFVASDICAISLKCARENFTNNHPAIKCEFIQGDYLTVLDDNTTDVIVCNPPYIKTSELSELDEQVRLYEPLLALDGGSDGLQAYRLIFAKTRAKLRQKGIIIVEIGDKQDKKVKKLAEEIFQDNMVLIGQKKDLKNHLRALAWQKLR